MADCGLNSTSPMDINNSESNDSPSHAKTKRIDNLSNILLKDRPNDPDSDVEDKGQEKHMGVTENSNISGNIDSEGYNKDEEVMENRSSKHNTEAKNQNNDMEENRNLNNCGVEFGGDKKHAGVNGDTDTVGHNEDEGMIKNEILNSDIEADNHDRNVNIEADDNNDHVGVKENSNSTEFGAYTTLIQMGVTENKSNNQSNTIEKSDMIEFEVDGINEDIDTEPIISKDNVEPSTGNGVTVKKKNRGVKELESLGVTNFKEEEDTKYDVYTDDSDRIYRKYRLRDAAKPNYRIPTEIEVPKARKPSNEILKCEECKKKFFSKLELRNHRRRVHNIVYTCFLCAKIFPTNAELISHKAIHEDEERSFMCHECKMAFSDHCDYLLHEVTHSKPNHIHKCPECGLSYTKHSYEIHIYTHFNKLMTCPICAKEIQGSHNLKNHINRHAVTLECVECGKVMNDKSNYEAHMAIHTGVKIHQCLYCGKGFRTTLQKAVHTRTHTKERPFTCKVCDRTFVQSTDLKRHMIRHHSKTGKEECKVCQKKCWDIALHMKVHATENLFDCPECGRQFTTVASLKAHVLFVHTTERPMECQLCDKKFVNQAHLNRHNQCKSHKNNLYESSLKKTDDV